MQDNLFLVESLKKATFGLKADTNLIRDVVSAGAQVGGAKDKDAADKEADRIAAMAGLMAQLSGFGKVDDKVISSDIAYDSALKPDEQITLNGKKMSLQELAAKAGSAVSGSSR